MNRFLFSLLVVMTIFISVIGTPVSAQCATTTLNITINSPGWQPGSVIIGEYRFRDSSGGNILKYDFSSPLTLVSASIEANFNGASYFYLNVPNNGYVEFYAADGNIQSQNFLYYGDPPQANPWVIITGNVGIKSLQLTYCLPESASEPEPVSLTIDLMPVFNSVNNYLNLFISLFAVIGAIVVAMVIARKITNLIVSALGGGKI